jgi:hypothetical protein
MGAQGQLARWAVANAIGMSIAFLAFIQTLMFLTFGLDFELHWSAEMIESLDPAEAERLLRTGLALGLPLAGAILTCSQVLAMRRRLPHVRAWVLAGPLGFTGITLLIWPFTAIWGDIPGPVEPFTIVGGGLMMTGILQWLSLRRQGIRATRWLFLWLAGMPLGMVVFMGLYLLVALVIPVSWAGEVALIGFSVGGTAAAVSGAHLFRSFPHVAASPEA